MAYEVYDRSRIAKAKRDSLYSKTPLRRMKNNESKRMRRAALKAGMIIEGMDYDHKDRKFKKSSDNRGNDGVGTKHE